jgi:hypothetical protein
MIIDRLHTLTHEIPGVPAHGTRSARAARPARPAHRHPHHSHTAHHHREPRVLVGWQRWIASLAERAAAKAGQD